MKNKKIIFISAFLILAFAGGMLLVTKRMEKSWNDTQLTTNNLSANSENIAINETTFDYPYIIFTKEEAIKHGLPRKVRDIWLQDTVSAEEINGRISYQQAANIAGELIKDIYGNLEPQTVPTYIRIEKTDETSEPKYRISVVNRGAAWSEDGLTYRCFIDAMTGKVYYFEYAVPGSCDIDVSGDEYSLTQQQAQNIFYDEVCTLLQMCGEESPVTSFRLLTENMSKDFEWYEIYVECQSGDSYSFMYTKYDKSLYYMGILVKKTKW